MRLQQSVVMAVLGLTLLGAGCNNLGGSSYSSSTDAYSTDTSTPAATGSTETSTPTADKKPMNLTSPGVLPKAQIENKQVRITTNKGDIVIAFYPDTAPLAVSNFIYLASQGYYDNVIFHRVIKSFMIQGGDPTGTGRGGPGYTFKDELGDDHTYTRGTVAMANAGPNTNGSQFFIMHQDYALPHDYTIFGHVTSGLDVVDAIATTTTDRADRPTSEIVMTKVAVEDLK